MLAISCCIEFDGDYFNLYVLVKHQLLHQISNFHFFNGLSYFAQSMSWAAKPTVSRNGGDLGARPMRFEYRILRSHGAMAAMQVVENSQNALSKNHFALQASNIECCIYCQITHLHRRVDCFRAKLPAWH